MMNFVHRHEDKYYLLYYNDVAQDIYTLFTVECLFWQGKSERKMNLLFLDVDFFPVQGKVSRDIQLCCLVALT